MVYFAKLRESWSPEELAAWKRVGKQRKKHGTREDRPTRKTEELKKKKKHNMCGRRREHASPNPNDAR